MLDIRGAGDAGKSGLEPAVLMSESDDLRKTLRDQLLGDLRTEYANVLETWKLLEGKAQTTMTVAGIFLAAVFAFARDLTNITPRQQVLIGTAVGLLVFAVCLGLMVLRIKTVRTPPLGTFTSSRVTDVLAKNDSELPQYFRAFLAEQVSEWTNAIVVARRTNDDKATWLWRSQLCLVVGIIATAGFTILRVKV